MMIKETGDLNKELLVTTNPGIDASSLQALNFSPGAFMKGMIEFVNKNRAALAEKFNHPEGL